MTHQFDPGHSGMSSTCNRLVEDADGNGTECGLPRAHVEHGMVPASELTDAGRHLRAIAESGDGHACRPWSYVPCAVAVIEDASGLERLCIREAGHIDAHVQDAAHAYVHSRASADAEEVFRRGPSSDPMARPTPVEFRDWFLAIPADRQVEVAAEMLSASQTAHTCFVFNHVGRIEAAEARVRELAEKQYDRLVRYPDEEPATVDVSGRAVVLGGTGDERLDTLPYLDLPEGTTRLYFGAPIH